VNELQQMVFHNEYTGPRWSYGLTYRPLDVATVPKGWIIGSLHPHPQFRFGVVDYPFVLAEHQVASYELTPIGDDRLSDWHKPKYDYWMEGIVQEMTARSDGRYSPQNMIGHDWVAVYFSGVSEIQAAKQALRILKEREEQNEK